MRDKIVAGNWKMNKTYDEGIELISGIMHKLKTGAPEDVKVIVAPPYTLIKPIQLGLGDFGKIKIAGQDCHHEKSGAFTGEVAAGNLKSCGADYVILGHSERRQYFKESDELIGKKVKAALASGLTPIFCCGETLKERENGDHIKTVQNQVKNSLFDLPSDDFKKLIIAYEPVWAIGTGKTATPEQAQEMHRNIRAVIESNYTEEIGNSIPILYGGSCKPHNAKELFGQYDIDGGLIGGASLKADDFVEIVNAFPEN